MIELQHVSKTFNKGRATEVNALNDINLLVKKGEYLVIVGANGSGKSTLLNIIAGNIKVSAGEIKIEGEDVHNYADYQRSKWIARVFQNPLSGTASGLSIIDNFRLSAIRTQGKNLTIGVNASFTKQVKEKIATLEMGLEDKLNQQMGTLSGGQRQALTLLMSVMDDCRILLLDEPTAALDPRSANIVMQTADKLVKDFGLTAVLITHNLKDAYTYGNRVIQMADGKIIRDVAGENKLTLSQAELFEWFS
ncbi:ATP-binding cassette domain-containing protein [Mucilaginibacter sp. RS28]|uniref:ATP-binding cassette domain-containing protein n=1 Tax=Mucilaginibacter straminoryzae TaxID=2932774 RepID=A0A9X2BA74_9SPHI|nr:ATP-binding cassette domain-containing protein [Mucilaginibacter straminoryzae]MCJ8211156.1 ATP-binding cassette domain-containing protein [Mucilaginibacter straminoryzae]